MLSKKYKTNVGTDFYGSYEAEKIQYIWESFKRICKSDLAVWPSKDSICLENGENFRVGTKTFPM